MRIKILGTAAAEGWPALFCACEACKKARELGGKDFRTRSSVMMDDEWKIDFPPDSLYHVFRYGLDFSKLRHLFFTHAHEDHMDVQELLYMVPPFGHNGFKENPLDVYLSEPAANFLRSRIEGVWHAPSINMHVLKPFEPIKAGDITATPLLADHMSKLGDALVYIFEKNGKRYLFTSDTGPLPEQSMEYLTTQKLDLIISEATFGLPMEPHKGHMGLGDVIRMREALLEAGSIKSDCPTWITHFSHNGNATHAEMVETAGKFGIQVAYDGVEIDF